jgi:hypothetical protein
MSRVLRTAAALSLLIGLAAPTAADTQRQPRHVGAFEGVEFDAAGELHIRQGAAEALVVQAEPRVLDRIRTETHAGTLSIRFDGPVQTRFPIRFDLTVRSLETIDLGGSGDLAMPSLETTRLRLSLSGSGQARLGTLNARELHVNLGGSGGVHIERGAVERQHIDITGAGDVDTVGLHSEAAVVSINGSGSVNLRANRRVDTDISGAGDVLVHGAARLSERITGAGEVRRAGR